VRDIQALGLVGDTQIDGKRVGGVLLGNWSLAAEGGVLLSGGVRVPPRLTGGEKDKKTQESTLS